MPHVKMSSTYDVGTKAWQPDPTEGWVPSAVSKRTVDGDKVKLVFTLENGEVWSHVPDKGNIPLMPSK